jgi:hypothetical protein
MYREEQSGKSVQIKQDSFNRLHRDNPPDYCPIVHPLSIKPKEGWKVSCMVCQLRKPDSSQSPAFATNFFLTNYLTLLEFEGITPCYLTR